MKKHFPRLLAVCLLGSMLLCSCHKTCTCIGFNGKEHTYTADEVEAFGGTCTDMKYMYTSVSSGADVRFYTVCNWD